MPEGNSLAGRILAIDDDRDLPAPVAAATVDSAWQQHLLAGIARHR